LDRGCPPQFRETSAIQDLSGWFCLVATQFDFMHRAGRPYDSDACRASIVEMMLMVSMVK